MNDHDQAQNNLIKLTKKEVQRAKIWAEIEEMLK